MILRVYQKLPSFAQIPHFILEKNPEDDVSRRHFQTCPSYHRSRKRSRTKKRHGWIPPGCGLVLCRFCFSLSFFRTRIKQLLFKWDSAKMLEICVITQFWLGIQKTYTFSSFVLDASLQKMSIVSGEMRWCNFQKHPNVFQSCRHTKMFAFRSVSFPTFGLWLWWNEIQSLFWGSSGHSVC